MPFRPLAAWSLIALATALPATAQEDEAPDAQTEAQEPAAQAPDAETPEAEAPEAQATPSPEGEPGGAGDADAATGDLGLSLGEGDDAQPGQVYVRETFTDWELRCERTGEGEDPCQLYQLLRDGEGNSVAEISLFKVPQNDRGVAAGATIITPLMTLLSEPIALSVDGATPKRYPFAWCNAIGCVAQVGFTDEEIAAFRGGNAGELGIVPAVAPDQRETLAISLAGFTAGFEALQESSPAIAP